MARSSVNHLRKVPAEVRGLSVEPLLAGVTLDLTGIDWCIVVDNAFDVATAAVFGISRQLPSHFLNLPDVRSIRCVYGYSMAVSGDALSSLGHVDNLARFQPIGCS